MKRIGILSTLLLFCAFAFWAQNISAAQDDTNAHKAAAQNDANAADQQKQDAKDARAANRARSGTRFLPVWTIRRRS